MKVTPAMVSKWQAAALARATTNGGYWWPEGAGEWATARKMVAMGLARHDFRQHGRFVLTSDGRETAQAIAFQDNQRHEEAS